MRDDCDCDDDSDGGGGGGGDGTVSCLKGRRIAIFRC